MDKGLSKQLFWQNEVPTPAGFILRKGEDISLEAHGMTLPCVVKPCCGGSSVGVTIPKTQEEYEAAVADAFSYEDVIVVEEYIKGREFSVGVVDGIAYPIIEIAPIEGFYDYTNKYKAGSTVETCPAVLTKEQTEQMQAYAVKGFKALQLDNYGRLDFMMSKDGKNVLSGSQYTSGHDTDQPSAAGSTGTWHGFCRPLRETDRCISKIKEQRGIFNMKNMSLEKNSSGLRRCLPRKRRDETEYCREYYHRQQAGSKGLPVCGNSGRACRRTRLYPVCF